MGTRRGLIRPRHLREPIWGADTHPCHDGPDLAFEWGAPDFCSPGPPRFTRRVALVLLLAMLAVSLFLPIGCALSRAEHSPPPKETRPVFQRSH